MGAIGTHHSSSLSRLRDHAVELARASTLEELRKIQSDEGIEDEGIQRTRRGRVQTKLRHLKPGSCCSIAALQTAQGDVVSDPITIATSLRDYWRDVFSSRPRDQSILRDSIRQEFTNGVPWNGDDEDSWKMVKESIEKAIQNSSTSAPGPHGIPYSAWRRLGSFGADVLFGVADFLCRETMDGATEHDFNVGNMVFLPKKIAGVDPLLGDYYTAADVRPLMIVNTDNRLVANGMRMQWEPIFANWISPRQQGFLPGRSMASNILEVDATAQCYALKHPRAWILLLDFKAAFPSISHEFLHSTLEALGVLSCARTAMKNLYSQLRCNISFGGNSYWVRYRSGYSPRLPDQPASVCCCHRYPARKNPTYFPRRSGQGFCRRRRHCFGRRRGRAPHTGGYI